MSFEQIGLGRLLKIVYSDRTQRISLIREDIRAELRSEEGLTKASGGDFYGSFWADAKRHIAGELDLTDATSERIASNKGRERLYKILLKGFLTWWNERRRLRNVPFSVIDDNIKARYELEALGTIKVENTLSISIEGEDDRIIYPYFCEDPSLSDEAARVALWVMNQCIRGYKLECMTIFDVI